MRGSPASNADLSGAGLQVAFPHTTEKEPNSLKWVFSFRNALSHLQIEQFGQNPVVGHHQEDLPGCQGHVNTLPQFQQGLCSCPNKACHLVLQKLLALVWRLSLRRSGKGSQGARFSQQAPVSKKGTEGREGVWWLLSCHTGTSAGS